VCHPQVEEFHIELGGVNFTPVILAKDMNTPNLTKGTTPKVQAFHMTSEYR